MSQSCCSLGFLSQNSLWKLSTFHGYKGIYSRVRDKCEKIFFYKIGQFGDSLVIGMSREFESRNNYQARLSFLSCSYHDPSASYMLHTCGILASR